MKVLLISAAYPPVRAGEAEHAFHLCHRLAEAGVRVDVVTNKGATDANHDSITVHPIMSTWSWTELRLLTALLKRCAPQAVLLLYSGWLYKDHPMITFSPTFIKKACPQTKFVTQFEIDQGAVIDDSAIFPRLVRKAVKHWVGPTDTDWEFGTLYRDSDAVIVMSDKHHQSVSRLFPYASDKTTLLPPPPLMSLSSMQPAEARKLSRARFGIREDDVLLAFFGYVYPRKGIDVLLKALRQVCDRRSNVYLAIIGGTTDDNTQQFGSYAEEMRNLAIQLGIDERVIWSGAFQTHNDFASVCLLSADACVLPFDQGVSLNRSSFAAAMAHGLPTITTGAETLEPQFVDRRNVLLCPVRDENALAACINELIDNPALQNALRNGARELATEWFSWEKAINVTLAALRH